MSRAIYRGLLRRKPTRRELVAQEFVVWARGGPVAALDRILRENEFSLMVLPDLVAKATVNWNGRHIFFLHVPKAAGTAFRIALANAIGVPAIMAYFRIDTSRQEDLAKYSFWPFLAGHAHVDDFPETHRGVTTLRETRARLLSSFRQNQRNLFEPPGGANYPYQILARSREALSMPFERWIWKYGSPQLPFFLPGISRQFSAELGVVTARRDLLATSPETRSALVRGLERFDACAWSHDRLGLEAALRNVSGRKEVSIRAENEFRPEKHTRPVSITPEARSILEELGRMDRVLFEVAHDVLGLPILSSSEADQLFEETAQRLGFTLG